MTELEITTRVGHAAWGENYYFGHAVNHELAGNESYTGLVALAVGAKRLSAEDRAVLDDIAVIMTVADGRIWPLKMTRVIASYGTTLPAIAAANLCIERAMIGHWTSGTAARALVDLEQALGENLDDTSRVRAYVKERLTAGHRWMGFGVPFRDHDERVESLTRCLTRRNRHNHRYFLLLSTLADVLFEEKGLRPNVGAAVGAACLDLGFTPSEISLLSVALGQTDYLSNAWESARHPREVLRRLPESNVKFAGRARRESPKQLSKDQTSARDFLEISKKTTKSAARLKLANREPFPMVKGRSRQ
jgi:hypothetical protein